MRILGIDPGTQNTGIGVIDIDDRGEAVYCYHGCIRTSRKDSLPERLKQIYSGLIETIETYHPDDVALEDIFYSENVKTAIVMGHARGVSLLAPIVAGITPAEYSPREVKLAVVGSGAASKEQVKFMVHRILGIREDDQPADATDALAVALCHHHRLRKNELLGNV